MQLTVDRSYGDLVTDFFRKNPAVPHSIHHDLQQITIEIDGRALPAEAVWQIQYHFRFLELFTWSGPVLEDVVFWQKAQLFEAIVAGFMVATRDLVYDVMAPVEARGFILGGMLAPAVGRPLLPVRKYKPCFGRFPGARSSFTNWRGEPEELFIFQHDRFDGARVLIVDDLVDTGSSLRAAIKALPAVGADAIGAFYLCNALERGRQGTFSIPIRSFVHRGPLPVLLDGRPRSDQIKEHP